MRSLVSLIFIAAILTGCTTTSRLPETRAKSPLGIYVSDSPQKFWLVIFDNDTYQLCSTSKCVRNRYQKVNVNYGLILIDFYHSEIGQQIERESHGLEIDQYGIEKLRQLRLNQPRPYDLAFNLMQCQDAFCASLGHTRDGIRFYKVEEFDKYWKPSIN
ncbi:MAG: hypothetical protein OQK04_15030 [Kangiellaceae bacterium]|nr:hypothetical protein [Kangiellaceae bacterium]MCW9000022.1 hypothetical protein [Kangiellaceae bacterium]